MGSWLPLESNPEVLNPYLKKLGVPENWGFCDVFGFDDELLAMLPQPCVALALLFPSEKIAPARREAFFARAQEQPAAPPELFFLQQHDGIGNACGTVACIHAIANAAGAHNFELEEGPLRNFLDTAKPLDVAQRGWELLKAQELQTLSDATAASGETAGAGTDDAQGQHFIAFVAMRGMLYELDGRNFQREGANAVAFPICHGATTPETFVSDAAKVIREDFMARDPTSLNFNCTALCKLD
jgi:ubiquitin carboxyl-terminal hydrolase L3